MKLFSLLYTDDTIILAESDSQMQFALTATANYCRENKLKVSPSKLNIVILSRGKVRKYHIFHFDGASIQYTSEYNYMGIIFKYDNKFGSALDRHLSSVERSIFAIINKWIYN